MKTYKLTQVLSEENELIKQRREIKFDKKTAEKLETEKFGIALSGGGIRGGQVHGASDAQAAFPARGRVEPQDLTATIFHCLGYHPETEVHDRLGRPFVVSKGKPVEAVI